VFDVDILRKHVYDKLEVELEKERAVKRLSFLAAHDQDLERYFNNRD
jgi:hypothetical protein